MCRKLSLWTRFLSWPLDFEHFLNLNISLNFNPFMHVVVLEQQICNWTFLAFGWVLANHFGLKIILAPFSFDISSIRAYLSFSGVTTLREARPWQSSQLVIIQFMINFMYLHHACGKNQKSGPKTQELRFSIQFCIYSKYSDTILHFHLLF